VSEGIGIPVRVVIPASYGASVQALVSQKADVAYLSAIPYLLAREETPMEILVVEQRDGRTDYDSVFVVAKDSPIQSLADLRGKRMMFTSPTSTSGYVMASSRLVDEGFLAKGQDPAQFFSTVNFGGGYDRALLAVLNGQADVCAVSDYTVEGEKTDVYITAENLAKLRVLAETPGVPTHLIAARAGLSEDVRTRLTQTLLKLSQEHPDLLADVYGASTFVAAQGDEHVAGAAKALENTGIGATSLVQ
jgi:phosphonate transport system substrate-binding protein